VHEDVRHIAYAGETNSEVVVPLVLEGRAVGVLDLQCLLPGGFSEEDVKGLQRLSEACGLAACRWPVGEACESLARSLH